MTDETVKVATPLPFVTPEIVVTVSETQRLEVNVTVFPEGVFPALSFKVTVIVETEDPLAAIELEEATTVEFAAEAESNITLAVSVNVTLAVTSVAV